ncbi:mannitol dehydrogenase family protein [Nitratireductor basaltis]|uniref:D-mannonate oxidoreductase n=1 Tax=Nitratireductor basaltis TaxID=472175 RepID=A0A084U8F7_9HYPH|nr:mannitol dehydrogenase family protein [Nitratireductor basaltis]KFB09243.1 D-mannonate oxidoreductase [Nitratireductor basaltis]
MSNIIQESWSHDRSHLKPRVLHIGFGAFSRAHTLRYLDDALDKSGGDFGAVVARLNSGADELSALDAQDHEYLVVEADDDEIRARRIGCVVGTINPGRDGVDALPDLIAAKDLCLVTLTITEKGYCLRNGKLDAEAPAISADLKNAQTPRSAIGVLVEGLRRRREAGAGGITLMACDNLPENGTALREAVVDYARLLDSALADWIGENVAFPSTMVDRIVPALDEAGKALIAEASGSSATIGIVCEPFLQWVIEDNFAGERPDFAAAGAMLVDDVRPYEEMKLRMLNGSHSFLAYLGALAGHETISDCMGDAVFRKAARTLMMQEQAPTLSVPGDVDLDAYADALIARFSNSRLGHRTQQIATDGSQKLPQRLLAPIANHLERGEPWALSALGVAGWMAYLGGKSEKGEALKLSDPLAERLAEIASCNEGDDLVEALLKLDAIFPPALVGNEAFVAGINESYRAITEQGVREAIAQACAKYDTEEG